MSVVIRKLTKGRVRLWVVNTWKGKRVWERAGSDVRAAERLDSKRAKEMKDGTYMPSRKTKATTVRQFASAWAESRKNRNASNDVAAVETHVLSREWFAVMPLADVRPRHVLQLVKEVTSSTSAETGKPLSAKTVANIYGLVRTMFRDARFQELTSEDPCVLPRGTFRRRPTTRRQPYSLETLRAMTGELVGADRRIWNALAFFTGMREGEVCGRRWSDWDREPKPLGSLMVETQYDGEPLKTDRVRVVPVHPDLAALLAWWWSEGFEFVYCRKPKPTDFIVPRRSGEGTEAHTKSSAYKAWRKSCEEAGVDNRSLHSTRHTFVSLARRNGARKEVIEQITHNAGGDIVDSYTTWDWAPLCEAVTLLTPALTGLAGQPETSGGAGNRTRVRK